ncbi:MAG TPA: RNA 2',3'-cyclic phosphodiesterase [Thermoanaerobaculia bacterium]|nr:RNA 2',3'-cyclic phosphodiesterase [Thermoanaerobaculia bacterium]
MRLFVALEIPEPVRREVARRVAGLRDRLPRARWVDLEKIHLTLLFLGQIPEDKIPVLSAKLRDAFARHSAITVRLGSGGTFPPKRPARVAWIGLDAPEELAAIQTDAVAAAAGAVGFQPEERPYQSHVTLARCEPFWPRDAIDKFTAAFPGEIGPPFTVDRGVLMESKLSPRGSRYRVVEAFPLEEALEGELA